MLRITIASGGGFISNAISIAKAETVECTPPQTPHARLLMYAASSGLLPFKIISYPRNNVAMELVEITFLFSRSTTL